MSLKDMKTALSLSAGILVYCSPAQAAAPDADEVLNESTTITVTARRIEEKLQDVPIAITAYTQQQLSESNVVNANDLAEFTPSLSANERFGVENTTFTIRGFTQALYTAPTVAVYFAEAGALRGASNVQSGEGAGPGSFFDLENVQVLKGPQGTLFGRNTTGGAILLVPRKPQSEFGGYGEVSYGNYDMTRLQAVLNIPVGNGGLRLGFDRMRQDGYLNNIKLGPARMADVNYIAARASFIQSLTPALENYTIFTYAKSDTNGATERPINCDPASRISNIPSGQMACDSIARIEATGNFHTVENPLLDPYSYMEQWQVINKTTWEVGDNLTLKNIITYGELRNRVSQDPLGTAWTIRADDPAAGINGPRGNFTGRVIYLAQASAREGFWTNAQSTFTEELQLHGISFGGKLDWQIGGYLETSRTIPERTAFLGNNFLVCANMATFACNAPYGFGTITAADRRTDFRDYGIFAQGIYSLTDKLRLTAGIRYTENGSKGIDEQFTHNFSNGVFVTTCANANAVLPTCSIVTPTDGSYFKTSAPTWLISLDYKPSEDILLYAKYSRGYRQGSVDPRALFPFKTYGPESLDAYEVGAKLSWGGTMPGFLNLATFYNDFSKMQFISNFATENRARTTTGIANTASSRLYGIEADAGVELFRGVRITGGLAYLNSRLLTVEAPSVRPPGFPVVIESQDVGNPFPLVPEFESYLKVAYRLPIDEKLGRLTIAGSWQYTSDFLSSGREFSRTPAYSTISLTANWTDVGGKPIDIGFFVNNLTNKKYYSYVTDTFSRGVISGLPGRPRTLGIRAKVRFGGDAD